MTGAFLDFKVSLTDDISEDIGQCFQTFHFVDLCQDVISDAKAAYAVCLDKQE